MKKYLIFTKLILMLILVSNISKADVLLDENFNYTVGDSLKTKIHYKIFSAGINGFAVKSGNLSYNGYFNSNIGNKITFQTSGQDLCDTLSSSITSGDIYYAFLLNVTSAQTTGDYFIGLGQPGSTSYFGKIFIKKSTNGFNFGLNKNNSSTGAYSNTEYLIGTTYLVVVKLSIVTGEKNDVASLYINPISSSDAPILTTNETTTVDPTSIKMILFRQGGASNSAILDIDGIRVATTWAEAVKPSAPVTTPIFSKQTKPSLIFPNEAATVSVKVNPNANTVDSVVYYENSTKVKSFLRNDVDSIYSYSKSATVGKTKYWFNAYYNSGSVLADTNSYTVSALNEVSKIRDLYSLPTSSYAKYTGTATVTLVTSGTNYVKKYIQDSTGAVLIYDASAVSKLASKRGDNVSRLLGSLTLSNGLLQFVPVRDSGTIVSSNNVVSSKVVSIPDLKANKDKYMSQLVTINEANIKSSVSTFKSGSFWLVVGTDTLKISNITDANYYTAGANVPTLKLNYTGIFTVNNTSYYISARDSSDMVIIPTKDPYIAASYSPNTAGLFTTDAITIAPTFNYNGNTIDSVFYIFNDNVAAKQKLTVTTNGAYSVVNAKSLAGTNKYKFVLNYTDDNSVAKVFADSGTYSVVELKQISKIRDLYSLTPNLSTYAKYTGEAVITFKQDNRNQKYIQDSTGAVLIDDATGVLKLSCKEGDKITNLIGNFALYGGLLEYLPVKDSGKVVSSGNVVTPKEITIADYKANYVKYVSQLILVKGVKFTTTATSFVKSTNYSLIKGSDSLIFRASFALADYIGQAIPKETLDITAIVAFFNNVPQIYVRKGADMVKLTGIEEYTKDKKGTLLVTPNPVESTFTLNIDVEAKVAIYNVTGQKVKELTFIPGSLIDVSDLTTGKYIVTTTLGDKAYSKVIIKK